MRIHSRVGLIIAAAVIAIGLAGCSQPTSGRTEAVAATEKPSPTPTAVRTVVDPVSGEGRGPASPQTVKIPIPDDAMSLVVGFACAGGGQYHVEFGDSMALGTALLTGTCDGEHKLAWPVTERGAMTLNVVVPTGVRWRATPTFSTAPFTYNAALTSDCKEFAAVDSEFMNADGGYRADTLDAAGWNTRVEKALDDLQTLAAASHSPIHESLVQLHAQLEHAHSRIGDAYATANDDAAPGQQINDACNTNQTPIVLTGEFGG